MSPGQPPAGGSSPLRVGDLVLASASPARRRLLEQSGIPHRVLVSAVDEDAVVARLQPRDPRETAEVLAEAKALDVARRIAATGRDLEQVGSHTLVLGCDSVAEMAPGHRLAGIPLGKPGSPEVAVERIRALRGSVAYLHTGHFLVAVDRDGPEPLARMAAEVTTTTLHFTQDLPDEEIDAYVASGEPLAVAGSFTLDGLAAPYIDRIDGDPSNVIGLSLPTLRRLLRALP